MHRPGNAQGGRAAIRSLCPRLSQRGARQQRQVLFVRPRAQAHRQPGLNAHLPHHVSQSGVQPFVEAVSAFHHRALLGQCDSFQPGAQIPAQVALQHRQAPSAPGQFLRQRAFQRFVIRAVNSLAQALAHGRFDALNHPVGLFHRPRLGRDAHIHLPGVRQQPHGGIGQQFQVADQIIHHRFTDPRSVQHAGLDRPRKLIAPGQIGDSHMLDQVLHLPRHARHADDAGFTHLADERRGGAHRVFHRDGPLGHVSLAAVVLRGLPPVALEALQNLLP